MENRSDALWQSCLLQIQDKIPADDFKIWLYPLQAEATAESLLLYASNAFVQKWVIDNYLPLILDVARQASANSNLNVSVIEGIKPTALKVEKPMKKQSAVGFSEEKSPNKTPYHANLNTKLVFENFVEGKSNQLARAVAQKVADNPGEQTANPLFLYGGTGLGKTHLLHAIGNGIIANNPEARVVYIHSERFVQQVVAYIRDNKMEEFKKFYRSLDALLVDDIQFFSDKEKTQEEFFHIFNTLFERGRQIILTSDRYPREIEKIEERLKSRFGWGLTTAIEPPDLETRVAILMKKAEENNVNLPHDVAFFIGQKLRTNVRELEGALNRVKAMQEFKGEPITIDFVRETLKDMLALQDKLVTVDNIQKVVAEYYRIKVSDLKSKNRSRSVARPRQVAMALAKELTNRSLPEIGKSFGDRDHTTVLHACRKVVELRESELDIQEDWANLIRILSV